MQKRQLILDTYKTAEDGQWTLASCKITKAAQVQHFEEVPGRFAPLDLSTILTDGQPCYGSAQLDAVLESSEGTRAERQERITEMVNLLDGRSVKIVHPDHPDGYMVGRVEIRPDFNGLAYSQVTVSAVLEPWRYNAEETRVTASLPHYEEGKNLLDIPDASTSGTAAYHQIMLGDFELPPGEYTISAKYKHIGEQRGSLDIREYENTSGYLKSIPIYANTSGETSATFTVPEGVQGIRVYLYSNVSGTAGATSVTLSEVMVNKGASALPYEPWYPLGNQLLNLTNAGKLAVVPLVDVVGEVALKYGDTTHTLSTGKYQLPGLYFTPDGGPARPAAHLVECSGAGTATFTYREAVLAE